MQKKAAVEMVVSMGLCKIGRACRALGVNRSTLYYEREESARKLAEEGAVEEVSRAWPCLGYEKVTSILRREHGLKINRKRVGRIRRQRGLLASRGGKKRRRIQPGEPLRCRASRADEVWSYDFVRDATADGGAVRVLSIIDEYTRECLYLRGGRSFPARRVIDALEEVMVCTGRKPKYVRSDNGPEFVAHSVQKWLERAQIGPRYIELGSPWENGCVESFHAQLRAELLDRELFLSMVEVEVDAAIEDWRNLYNHKRPHGSLGNLPPAEAAKRELPLRPTACAPVPAGKVLEMNYTKNCRSDSHSKVSKCRGRINPTRRGRDVCRRWLIKPRLPLAVLPRKRANCGTPSKSKSLITSGSNSGGTPAETGFL